MSTLTERRTVIEVAPHPIADEIKRRMGSAGLNMRQLSLKAGLGPSYVRDVLTGRTPNPKSSELAKIANALGCTLRELEAPLLSIGPDRDLGELMAARFKAARWACWEDASHAAKWLQIDPLELAEIESGAQPITDEILRHFSTLTGCPLVWFQSGSMAGMPPEMAARIGYYDPTLLPPAPDQDRT